MVSRRRIVIGFALTALAAAGCAAGGWYWWAPNAVRARVASAAAERGLLATVGSVDIGWERVVLRDVQAVTRVDGVSVRVAEVQSDAGVWALTSQGASAVRALTLRHVQFRLDLDAPGLPEALRTMRGDGSTRGATSGPGRLVVMEDLSVVVRDRRGALVRLARGRLSLDPEGTVQLTAGPVELAPTEADGARVERARVRVSRGADGFQIAHASLLGVAVRYRERAGTARSPLWARLRQHTRQFDDDVAGTLEPPSGGEPPDDGAAGDDGGAGGAALLSRARQVLGPRLSADALLQLTDLSVVASSAEGDETVLRDLEAEIRALPEGRFQLNGSGRPGRGGRLGWRLVVDPEELRAEGRLDFQRLPFVLVTPMLPSLPWHRPEDTRLSGELSVEGRGASRVHLDGSVTVDDLALASPRIASRPVQRIALGMTGTADWDPITRRLEVPGASVSLGNATVQVAGSLEWPDDHYLLDVRATLPPTDCNTAVGAIPADLLDELSGFGLRGQIGGRIQARIDSRDLDASTLDVRVADGCLFDSAPATADVRRFQAPFVHRVLEPDGTTFEMHTGPGSASWTPIRDISPFLVHAVLGHEDGGFFSHRGFADHAIQQALVRNLRAGRYVYGASTITMQLVKNVFLHREKTLARKVQEVLLTWWVESVMRKEQILELYLNVIEYGPGVYGIRNAAAHYFGRAPDELGPAESAYLATILPNPKAYHSHWQARQLPEAFRRRVGRFIQILGSRRRYDPEAVALGIEQLGRFRFQAPGDPPPPEPDRRGATGALPFGTSLDRAWREALGEPEDEPETPEAPDDAEQNW